jgi:cyclopropane-fatty-acyl-phospholipid synthase
MKTLQHESRLVTTSCKPGFLDTLAKRAVLSRLSGITEGRLRLIDGDETHQWGNATQDLPATVTVHVHDPRAYFEVAFGGSIGSGEAYMQGYWVTNDLTGLVKIFLRNREVLDAMETGLARVTEPISKLLHWLNRNTLTGSRRNVAAHYDLGNEFFQLFLDETMMYSAAVFERPDMTLEEASIAKIDRICRKLALSPDDHLLEIGTGWGWFAIHAARTYGCRVTTTTISPSQHEFVARRVRNFGLDDRVTVLLSDYRDLAGHYDKLVSIEMIEAIGHAYYDTYFKKCSALLRPEGMMLLQAITIADQRFEQAKQSVDFIQRYIFPGSCLPSILVLADSVARVTDLSLFHLEDIGPHYVTTLRKWRERFLANIPAIQSLGYSDVFIRMWEFYLCYCEGGFGTGDIGDVQMLFVKPRCNARR